VADEYRNSARARPIKAASRTLGGVIAIAVPMALLAVPLSDTVAVVGASQDDAAVLVRIVADAGGSVLSLGARPNIVIARAETGGFVRRLYGAGARLVLDGRLARFCGRPPQPATLTSRPLPGPGTSAP
jgi:hypothetical protein